MPIINWTTNADINGTNIIGAFDASGLHDEILSNLQSLDDQPTELVVKVIPDVMGVLGGVHELLDGLLGEE